MESAEFSWVITPESSFPPSSTGTPPFGVTFLENFKNCSLRVHFEASPEYFTKRVSEAHVGTAFHKTIENLINSPIEEKIENKSAYVKDLFHNFLKEEEARGSGNPREAFLPKNHQRIHLALTELLAIYPLLPRKEVRPRGLVRGTGLSNPLQHSNVAVEVFVESKSKLIRGIVDKAELTPNGIHLVDYKSALRTDLPEKYKQQLQLYAALWFESYGSWPISAEIIYPLTKKTVTIQIEPEICTALLQNFGEIIERFQKGQQTVNPGDCCSFCSFKPWCTPFWDFVNSNHSHNEELKYSRLGINAVILTSVIEGRHQFIEASWKNKIIELNFLKSRFPHLEQLKGGQQVRMLDFTLQGIANRPVAKFNDFSEVFIVSNR